MSSSVDIRTTIQTITNLIEYTTWRGLEGLSDQDAVAYLAQLDGWMECEITDCSQCGKWAVEEQHLEPGYVITKWNDVASPFGGPVICVFENQAEATTFIEEGNVPYQ